MSKRLFRHVLGRPATIGGLALLTACSGATLDSTSDGVSENDLIGGFAANSSTLDAIGSLGVFLPDDSGGERFRPFCTGTLITQETVLTAKHCLPFFDLSREGKTVAFGLGPNGLTPARTIEIVAVSAAPGVPGVELDNDVGVVHLAEKVTDVRPLPLRKLSADQVGKDFVAIGYGIRDEAGNGGTRRAGKVQLRGVEGSLLKLVFPTFEDFKAWYLRIGRREQAAGLAAISDPSGAVGSGGVGSLAIPDDETLQAVYESTLKKDYEAFVGGGPYDAQPCNGDSGGPLLRFDSEGELGVYGVASWVLFDEHQRCALLGAVYATFGPDVSTFIDREMSWTDPCGDLSTLGECAGTKARRCTTPEEGPRRVTELDCAAIGQACTLLTDGPVECADP